MLKQYIFLILLLGIILNTGYYNINWVVRDSVIVFLIIFWRFAWSGKNKIEKIKSSLNLLNRLPIWETHLPIYPSLCCLSKSGSCLGELSIWGYPSSVLRFLIVGHAPSEPQLEISCPLTTDKQMPNIYYPWNVPGLSSSGSPELFKVILTKQCLCGLVNSSERWLWLLLLLITLPSCQFLAFVMAFCHWTTEHRWRTLTDEMS